MIRMLFLLFSLIGAPAFADTLRLAVTTSFHNSGLSDVLLPAILEDTRIEVQLLVVGTGQALRLGAAGDVDAILVHSRAAEDRFVVEGFAPYRREIMFNDFVFVGPKDDPAGIAAASDISDVLHGIKANKTPFVSRGDDSGTHKKELSLWRAAQLNPDAFDTWYKSVGSGMGASLNTATGFNAYILADRASWLNFGNKGDLAVLFFGDPALHNQYAYLPINPARHPHVNANAAETLEAWLVSPRAEQLINSYTIDAQPLFFFNAQR